VVPQAVGEPLQAVVLPGTPNRATSGDTPKVGAAATSVLRLHTVQRISI
jgi:hypothetical protein